MPIFAPYNAGDFPTIIDMVQRHAFERDLYLYAIKTIAVKINEINQRFETTNFDYAFQFQDGVWTDGEENYPALIMNVNVGADCIHAFVFGLEAGRKVIMRFLSLTPEERKNLTIPTMNRLN